jgi:hypothetical protein
MIILKAKDLVIGLGIAATRLASSLTKKKVLANECCESARISTTKLKALKNATTQNRLAPMKRAIQLQDSRVKGVTYATVTQTRLDALSAHLNKNQEFTIDEL